MLMTDKLFEIKKAWAVLFVKQACIDIALGHFSKYDFQNC